MIRTPKPHYFKFGVIEFFTKSKQIFYSIKVWNKDGTNQALIKLEKYNGENIESLIPQSIKCNEES